MRECAAKVSDVSTPASVLDDVRSLAARYRGQPEKVIQVVREAQALSNNGAPLDVARVIGEEMGVPVSKIYDIATFYSFLSVKPRGKNIIRICRSAPSHARGCQEVIDAFKKILGIELGETTLDGKFTLETCECLGICHLSPSVMINKTVHGHLSPEKVPALLNKY
ncbi:MAG: NAD(P)H-dependent oxidoreductase subunit E [Clostridiales bacterium]|nr:NAD(P)H-dependent oxidoreductase subunit E [Clostridiales bacterium]